MDTVMNSCISPVSPLLAEGIYNRVYFYRLLTHYIYVAYTEQFQKKVCRKLAKRIIVSVVVVLIVGYFIRFQGTLSPTRHAQPDRIKHHPQWQQKQPELINMEPSNDASCSGGRDCGDIHASGSVSPNDQEDSNHESLNHRRDQHTPINAHSTSNTNILSDFHEFFHINRHNNHIIPQNLLANELEILCRRLHPR